MIGLFRDQCQIGKLICGGPAGTAFDVMPDIVKSKAAGPAQP